MSRAAVGVSAIVVNRSTRSLLMIKREHEPYKGLWTLPGGKLEYGESLADGMKREVQEETGAAISSIPSIEYFVNEIISDDSHYVIVTGVFDYAGMHDTVSAESMTIHREWMSIDAVLDRVTDDNSPPRVAPLLRKVWPCLVSLCK